MRPIQVLGGLLVLMLVLASCVSSRSHRTVFSPYTSCRFEVIMPTDKHEKINGVVQLYQDSIIRISFRAPMVRSELALLVYKPSGLLVVDRTNKLFAEVSYPIDPVYGIRLDSFSEFQSRILRASKIGKPAYFLASDLGWTAFGEATVQLYRFTDIPFEVHPLKLSKRYQESSLGVLMESMGL